MAGTKIDDFKMGDTIDLTNVSIGNVLGTPIAGGALTFTFASPSGFGTSTFSLDTEICGLVGAPPVSL